MSHSLIHMLSFTDPLTGLIIHSAQSPSLTQIQSLIYSLIYSLTHSLTHLPLHSLTHSDTDTHSFTSWAIHSFSYTLINSPVPPHLRSLSHLFIPLYIYIYFFFIYSPLLSLIHTHTHTHSLTFPVTISHFARVSPHSLAHSPHCLIIHPFTPSRHHLVAPVYQSPFHSRSPPHQSTHPF